MEVLKKFREFYSMYMDAINDFLGLEIELEYDEKSKDVLIQYVNISDEILEIDQTKFEDISDRVKRVLLDFYKRFETTEYQPIYKQLLIEELAYSFITIDQNQFLAEFVEKIKSVCNKTYELECTQMGFIISRNNESNIKETLNQVELNYHPFVETKDLDYFLTEKQTLKLVDSKSICLVLNSKYEVMGIAQKRKGHSSISDIMHNRHRLAEEDDIKSFSTEYYVKSQINYKSRSERIKLEMMVRDVILIIKTEFNLDIVITNDNDKDIENILEYIEREGIECIFDKEQRTNFYEQLNVLLILQERISGLLSSAIEGNEKADSFYESSLERVKEEKADFAFVYFKQKQIFWSASFKNMVIYSNGRWKLRNYFLLRNILTRHVMIQHEVQQQAHFNLERALNIINNSVSMVLDLYKSIKSLSDKNIGSLICILKKSDFSSDDIYSKMLVEKKLSLDIYKKIIQDKNEKQLNVTSCDSFLFELICSIDGAVILDYIFDIQSMGEMISTENIKSNKKYRGARTLAALAASNFGLAIKVSEDGDILIFEAEDELLRI